MSYALAFEHVSGDRRSAAPRRHTTRYKRARVQVVLPLTQVSLAPAAALRQNEPRKPPAYVGWLAVAAIAAHGALIWYVTQFAREAPALPVKREVAVELVRPPKPLEQKIEPPKPVKKAPQPAKVLPQIQTATPEPSVVAENVPAAEPVVVAPVVTAPVEQVVEESVSEPIGYAGYLSNPPPEYPAVAVRQRWQGTVVLSVHVLADGHVASIEVRESSGRRVLDDQAVRTVKSWLFTPSKRGETPIDGWATVPIEFRLDG